MAPADELKSMLALASEARVPFFLLLGGPARNRLRVLLPGPGRPSAVAKRSYLLEAGRRTVADAAAIASAGADFAVRCPAGLRTAAAVKLALELQPYKPQWIGHPDPRVVRQIAAKSTAPVAAMAGHLELLADETADLLVLDVPALGVRRCMALGALAETHYAGVVLANCVTEPWRNAGMHLAAALPNFLAIEAGEAPVDRDGYTELPR